VLLENNSQEQLIFKHAISTVVSNRGSVHTDHRLAGAATDTVVPVAIAAVAAGEQR
jgi:host factor-I protein